MSKVEQQLSSILPPREINKDGQLFIQRVSSEPASRKTIIEKSELLDKLLTQAQVSLLFVKSRFSTGKIWFPTWKIFFPTSQLKFPTHEFGFPTYKICFPPAKLQFPRHKAAFPMTKNLGTRFWNLPGTAGNLRWTYWWINSTSFNWITRDWRSFCAYQRRNKYDFVRWAS